MCVRSGLGVLGALVLLSACKKEKAFPAEVTPQAMDVRSEFIGTYIGTHHYVHAYYGTVDCAITYQDTFLVQLDSATTDVLIVDGFPVVLLPDSSLGQAVNGLTTGGHFSVQNGGTQLTMFIQYFTSPSSDTHYYNAERH